MTSKAFAHLLFGRSGGFGFDDLTDAGLARLRVSYERGLLDQDDPEFVYAGGTPRKVRRWLNGVIAEQEKRAALAECWMAREDGTDSTVEFWAQFDEPEGKRRFFAGEGVRPNYWLALLLDYQNFHSSGVSVMAWDPA